MEQSRASVKRQMYAVIRDWESGSESQRAVCARHGVTLYKFKYWKRKRGLNKPTSKTTPIASPEEAAPANTFIPLQVEQAPLSDGQYHLHFPNGVELHCPIGTAASELCAIIRQF